MLAEDIGELDGVLGAGVVLVGDEADAAATGAHGRQRERHGTAARVVGGRAAEELESVAQIGEGVLVERRGLPEDAVVVRDLGLHEETRAEHGVPLQRLVVGSELDFAVPAARVEIPEARSVVALRPAGALGRVTEEGQLDLVLRRHHPVELQRVVVGGALAIQRGAGRRERRGGGNAEGGGRCALAEHRLTLAGRQAVARGAEGRVGQALRRKVRRGEHRIVGDEVEQLVLDERAAHGKGQVVDVGVDEIGGAGIELDELPRRLQRRGAAEPFDTALEVVRPRLDDGVDDPAQRLAVLRLEAAGLDLHLVQEVAGHAGAERTVVDVVGANAAVAGVGDVHAVDQVGVLQPGGAADRVVALPGPQPADDSGRDRVGVGERAPDRHGLGEVAVLDVGAGGRRADVDQRCLTGDRDGLGLARLEREVEGRPLVQPDRDVVVDHGGEPAGRLGPDGVGRWTQERQDVAAVDVGLGGPRAKLRRRDDDRAGDRASRRIGDLARQSPGRQILGRRRSHRDQERQ